MASRNPPTGSYLLVPDVFVYICGHSVVGDEHGLQSIYGSLLDHGLIPRAETACELTHHCPKCLDDAFEEALGQNRTGTSKRKWGDMALHPLQNPTTDITVFRMSAMVMFRDLWELLNTKSLHPFFFSRDVLTHDIFFAFRHWCKTMALHVGKTNNNRTFEQLVAVLGDLFGGWPVALDVSDLLDFYRLQSREVDEILPKDRVQRAGEFRICYRGFQQIALAASAGPYPLDLANEFHAVLRSASRFSAELLGPPQHRDLHRDLFAERVRNHPAYGPEEQARLEKVLLELNDAAMLFKVQLYEMFKYTEKTGLIKDERELLRIMGLVNELEGRYDFICPLWDEKRRLWRLFVDFAEPHRDLFALASMTD